jgi:hypothetical protein
MSEADKFSKCAVDALELAKQVSSKEAKMRLMRLAEAWLDLADSADAFGAADQSGKPVKLHPLIKRKLDQYLDG